MRELARQVARVSPPPRGGERTVDLRHMLFVEAGARDVIQAAGMGDVVRVLPPGWHANRALVDDLYLARALVLEGADVERVTRVARQVSQLNPEMCIYLVSAGCAGGAMSGLARAGVHDCFGTSRSELHPLSETLTVLVKSSFGLPPGVLAEIGAGFEARVVRFCLLSGRRNLGVQDVADWFGRKLRTLGSQVKERTGHSIAFWLNEGRILYAGARHEDGLSYTRIAHEMDYAGASSVSMLIERWRERELKARSPKKNANE